jgi:hypothetical protein
MYVILVLLLFVSPIPTTFYAPYEFDKGWLVGPLMFSWKVIFFLSLFLFLHSYYLWQDGKIFSKIFL